MSELSLDMDGHNLGEVQRLDEVIERDDLGVICRSFFELFGLSIRVYSKDGSLLADAHETQQVCQYVNTIHEGAKLCGETVNAVQAIRPGKTPITHPCFTGTEYRVVPVRYQARAVGHFVLGPFVPASRTEVPRTLLKLAPGMDRVRCQTTLTQAPRVRAETADKMIRHLKQVFDIVLFTSHRARLASEVHVASVREHYRDLAEKTNELQQAYDRLQELDRLKSNFLATISHELRTPLTSIIGYAEMLANGLAGELSEEQTEFAKTIEEKGEHLLALITSLLDMSRLEQGSLRLDRTPIAPGTMLEDVIRTVRIKAERKQINLETEFEKGIPYIDGDPVRVRQILVNLTDNAIKFTPVGGTVTLRAKLSSLAALDAEGTGSAVMEAPRKAVALEVEDTGMGIPASELERIYDSFYQVDSSSTRQHEGVGLGLAIVERLVRAHGGTIDVQSTVRKGTTFSVRLPQAAAEFLT